MKKNYILESVVGLFILVGILATLFLAFRVSGSTSGHSSKQYTLYALFSDIGSLKVKAPIRTAGVTVGRVADIQLDPDTYWAKVTLSIDQSYQFSTDTTAQILTSGLLGEQYISLAPGSDETWLKNGENIHITNSALVLEQLIGKFMGLVIEKNAGIHPTQPQSESTH